VDDATRTVIKSHQIDGWDNFPLADWIGDMLGLPTALGNDADVAGLAEALFGAGQGLSPVFYITIGSGIGGGLIINGEIYRGCGRGAAEIGHLQVTGHDWSYETDYPCPLENMGSGWSIEERTRRRLEFGNYETYMRKVVGQDLDRVTTRLITEAAIEGDEMARDAINEALGFIAEGIRQVIALLCPRRFVIGGGVSLMGEDLLFQPLRELVAERVFKPFAECYDIVPSALGEEVVVHGALALARKRLSG
jgi:glucokinase